jgi:outer membrane protein assembly factor BamE
MRRFEPSGKRFVRNPVSILSALGAAALLGGCSYSHLLPHKIPFVYRIDIQQGNVITQDMLAKLKPGMDKAKVRFIMGTPLIIDTFHDDRWDYVYTFQKNGGERVERHVTLHFKDGKLASVSGNVKPASGELKPQPRREETIVITNQHKEGFMTRMLHDVGVGKDKAAASKSKEKAAEKQVSTESSGTQPATKGSEDETKKKAQTAKTTTEADAEPTPEEKKSFFGRLLDKIGLGKGRNESGDYHAGNPVYRDPTNPDDSQQPQP